MRQQPLLSVNTSSNFQGPDLNHRGIGQHTRLTTASAIRYIDNEDSSETDIDKVPMQVHKKRAEKEGVR